MIKDLEVKLRETSDGDEFQQTLGVIRYLSELKVGSWVTTPESSGPELVIGISSGVGKPFNGAEIVETLNGGCWGTNDVEVVG